MLEKARMIQIAWFPTGADIASPLTLFTKMFGREPDSFQRLQPPQTPFPITVQGFVENNVEHKLQAYAGRIDYLVQGVAQTPEIPLVNGDLNEVVSAMISAAERGAETIGNINRAAVVLNLAQRIETVGEAAAFFERLFGGVLSFEGQLDLIFQTNRRLKGQLKQDEVNQLQRWSCDSVQVQQMVSLPNSHVPTAAGGLVEMLYLNHMIDINVAPSSTTYSPPEHHALISQLASIALGTKQVSRIQDL